MISTTSSRRTSEPADVGRSHTAGPGTRPLFPARSLAWAAYAACGWAIAYAIGVRGYQGLGGTLGLPGTFEDPAAIRRASLVAGAGILLVGVGALALVRPWGLRLHRWLVIVPALTGSADAAGHASPRTNAFEIVAMLSTMTHQVQPVALAPFPGIVGELVDSGGAVARAAEVGACRRSPETRRRRSALGDGVVRLVS